MKFMKTYCTIAKEKAAKHIPVKIRRNWPISIGFIASSKAFMYLPVKRKNINRRKALGN
jgi:hypothetical protein